MGPVTILIDADDARYADLKVWQDANGDGISQSDELRSLTEAGITSISLSYREVESQQGTDGQIAHQGIFTRADGASCGMWIPSKPWY